MLTTGKKVFNPTKKLPFNTAQPELSQEYFVVHFVESFSKIDIYDVMLVAIENTLDNVINMFKKIVWAVDKAR